MKTLKITRLENNQLIKQNIQNKKEVVTLVSLLFKNIVNQIPGWGVISGTAIDYYQEKISPIKTIIYLTLGFCSARIE